MTIRLRTPSTVTMKALEVMVMAVMTWSGGWRASISVSIVLFPGTTLSGLENTERYFVGSASADKIWAVLTTEERARFTRAVQDPDSELAKTLLTSPDLAEDIPAPWWMTLPSTPQASGAPTMRHARPPDVMAIPEALLTASRSPPHTPAFPLAYNLVAILWVPS